MNKKVIIVMVILFMIASLIVVLKEPKVVNVSANKLDLIEVEISGEVIFPGKYQILQGANLGTLVKYAGGFNNQADISSVNQSQTVVNNQKYEVKRLVINQDSTVKINLNEADFKTLLTLDGITENRAVNILVYRNQLGKFKEVEELLNVKGIGEVTYDKIKNYFICR